MPIAYSDADDGSRDLLESLVAEFFPGLSRLAVPLRIDLRMAVVRDKYGEDSPDEPAVKRFGYPVPAKAEVVKPEERSRGGPDVRIKVDATDWAQADEHRRRGMLYSEVRRFEPQRDKHGSLRLDPYNRPIVKLGPHDWLLTGYRDAVRIFGHGAVERRELDRVEGMLRQADFGFIAEKTDEFISPDGSKYKITHSTETDADDVVEEAFAALISVGHTEDRARAAIGRVLESGRRPETVADFIEAVYADVGSEPPAPAGPPVSSVSLSGRDFDTIGEAGKKLRRKAAMGTAE